MLEPLETERLILRKWEERDRSLFHQINSDEKVMRFFPFRRSREEADALMDIINQMIETNGVSFSAIELKTTGACIGFCGLHVCSAELGLPKDTIEIGWRLSPDYWGNGYATEAAERWLEYGFLHLDLQEIVSFAVKNNQASIAVMKRIGMMADPKKDFDHPSVGEQHAHLRRHVYYYLSKDAWTKLNRK